MVKPVTGKLDNAAVNIAVRNYLFQTGRTEPEAMKGHGQETGVSKPLSYHAVRILSRALGAKGHYLFLVLLLFYFRACHSHDASTGPGKDCPCKAVQPNHIGYRVKHTNILCSYQATHSRIPCLRGYHELRYAYGKDPHHARSQGRAHASPDAQHTVDLALLIQAQCDDPRALGLQTNGFGLIGTIYDLFNRCAGCGSYFLTRDIRLYCRLP